MRPYAPFMLSLTVFDSPILPKHVYDGQGDVTKNAANLKPSAPDRSSSLNGTKGSTLKLVRNENYFEKGKPYLDALVFQIVPQGANRSTALETGEVDFVVDFICPRRMYRRLEKNAQVNANARTGRAARSTL